jgi:hypothetical protein
VQIPPVGDLKMNETKIKCPEASKVCIEEIFVPVDFCKVCLERIDCPTFIAWLNSKTVNPKRKI